MDNKTKERPILFSAPMVRALLDGTKTQTRRVVKPQPIEDRAHDHVDRHDGLFTWWAGNLTLGVQHEARCPYGQPGDRLWVRETWQHSNAPYGPYEVDCDVFYRADYMDDPHGPDGELSPEGKYRTWRPSIHMPRVAGRILLEIVSVRVERLNDCSARDAIAEGIHRYEHFWRDSEYPLADVAYEPAKGSTTRFSCPVQAYRALWEDINGAGSWDANPWVWCVEFKRIEPVQA